MPYEYVKVPAQLLVQYRNIPIHYTYNNDDVEEPRVFWYCLGDEEDGVQFDIRSLLNYQYDEKTAIGKDRTLHANIIHEAIAHGYLDKEIEKAGYLHPSLYKWPTEIQTVDDLEYWQLKKVVVAYDKYIEDAKKGLPRIGTFYQTIFMQELKEELE